MKYGPFGPRADLAEALPDTLINDDGYHPSGLQHHFTFLLLFYRHHHRHYCWGKKVRYCLRDTFRWLRTNQKKSFCNLFAPSLLSGPSPWSLNRVFWRSINGTVVVKSRHFLFSCPHVDFMEQFTVIGNRKFAAINRNWGPLIQFLFWIVNTTQYMPGHAQIERPLALYVGNGVIRKN